MSIAISRRTVVPLALIAALALTIGYACHKSTQIRSVLAAGKVSPQPLPLPGFPVAGSTIDGWIAAGNETAMRAHGWALWAALGTVTPETNGLPTYETWYTSKEVQNGPVGQRHQSQFTALREAGRATQNFEVPEQFHHNRFHLLSTKPAVQTAVVTVIDQPVVSTKFDSAYAHSIWANDYQNTSTIWNLQAKWGTITPVSRRLIKPFTAPSVSLKPTYEIVNGPTHSGGLTVIKYWLGSLSTGPQNSTDPAQPTPDTWKQCVVVDTSHNSDALPNPKSFHCNGTTIPATGIVNIDKFYHYVLTQDDVVAVCSQLASNEGLPSNTSCPIQAGDYAVLVGMHVSTKENSNWTWQSFWWNYNQPFPYGAPPSSVPAPFNNYAMCTGYSMTTNPPNSPSGTNTECYNPYLETGLGPIVQGIKSNCMACHSVASIGNNPNALAKDRSPRNSFGYPTFASGTADITVWNKQDDKDFYDCQTATDFSWFLADYVAGGTPSTQAPCVLTAVLPPRHHKK